MQSCIQYDFNGTECLNWDNSLHIYQQWKRKIFQSSKNTREPVPVSTIDVCISENWNIIYLQFRCKWNLSSIDLSEIISSIFTQMSERLFNQTELKGSLRSESLRYFGRFCILVLLTNPRKQPKNCCLRLRTVGKYFWKYGVQKNRSYKF